MLSSRWNQLRSINDYEQAIQLSFEVPVAIFKHSTRCGISSFALDRVEKGIEGVKETELFYLDLLQFREISNHIASDLNVIHQSPQLIIIKDGNVEAVSSHHNISAELIS